MTFELLKLEGRWGAGDFREESEDVFQLMAERTLIRTEILTLLQNGFVCQI